MAAEKVANDENPTEYLEKVALDDSGRSFVPPSAAEESAVIRKLDWHLLPLVFVLYSLSVLDRSNLGNAKLAGMTKDINLTGNRYNWLGTLFYIACKSLSPFIPFTFSILELRDIRQTSSFNGPSSAGSTSLLTAGPPSWSSFGDS